MGTNCPILLVKQGNLYPIGFKYASWRGWWVGLRQQVRSQYCDNKHESVLCSGRHHRNEQELLAMFDACN
jgi:hypothetical protein